MLKLHLVVEIDGDEIARTEIAAMPCALAPANLSEVLSMVPPQAEATPGSLTEVTTEQVATSDEGENLYRVQLGNKHIGWVVEGDASGYGSAPTTFSPRGINNASWINSNGYVGDRYNTLSMGEAVGALLARNVRKVAEAC